MPRPFQVFVLVSFLCCSFHPCWADISVIVSDNAGPWEARAGQDLAQYLEKMLGQSVTSRSSLPPKPTGLEFVVGQLALELEPNLTKKLKNVAKEHPVFRADAIVIEKVGERIYLAGSNDDSHYFAVSAFLQKQGCRWYLPTEFGQCIPRLEALQLQNIDTVYAPPFEVRTYWISWNGDRSDYESFAHRNFFNLDRQLSGSHALGNLLPKPDEGEVLTLNAPETIKAVVDGLEKQQAQAQKKGQKAKLSVGISDAAQALKSEVDRDLSGRFYDKYFYTTAAADTFLPFYNAVCRELRDRQPDFAEKIGFLAYTNLTLPPQRDITADEPLVAFLAPIDIDPSHSLTDIRSPERLDFLGAVKRWAEVMQGRVIMYDYDQGMMVWRDIPEPSHEVFRQDVKVYRDLGILGFATESRNAIATTFTNLFFRGQLSWNPDFDVDTELELFYKNFYGPAAPSMKSYWSSIYDSFDKTLMIDHEFFVIPSLYPQALVSKLAADLATASADVEPYRSRLAFTRNAFEVLENYMKMTKAGASECDYRSASEFGTKGLEARDSLTERNPTFTTYKKMPEKGAAWWPGEVAYYESLAQKTDGTTGHLVTKLPLQWHFRMDPKDHGLWRGWGATNDFSQWDSLDTDQIPRAQGLVQEDFSNPEGFGWYACQVNLTKLDLKAEIHLLFPGLFNDSWLYVNGHLIASRQQRDPWWGNAYTFEWETDVSQALQPGLNTFVVRTKFLQHPSGIFRRPFLYRKASQ